MATTTLARPTAAAPDDLRTAAMQAFGAAFAAVLTAHGELAVSTRQFLQELLRLQVAHTNDDRLFLMRGIHVLNLRLAADELTAHPERRTDVRAAAERFERKMQRSFEQPLTLGDPLPRSSEG